MKKSVKRGLISVLAGWTFLAIVFGILIGIAWIIENHPIFLSYLVLFLLFLGISYSFYIMRTDHE